MSSNGPMTSGSRKIIKGNVSLSILFYKYSSHSNFLCPYFSFLLKTFYYYYDKGLIEYSSFINSPCLISELQQSYTESVEIIIYNFKVFCNAL